MGVYFNKYKLYSIKGKYKDDYGNFIDYHRFTGKKGFKSKKQAERADREFREQREIAAKEHTVSSTYTFKDLIDTYYE